ncbi:unnamed protein product [Discosporangium mesarthrocarpum]
MTELHLRAFPGAPGATCCLGGDWPLGPDEILLHPQDLETLSLSAFDHVKLRGGRALGDIACGEEYTTDVVFCRAIPEDSLIQGEAHVPQWVMWALGVTAMMEILVSPPLASQGTTIQPIAKIVLRLTKGGLRNKNDNCERSRSYPGIPEYLDLSGAVARRLLGCLILGPGSLLATEILGELRVFRVFHVEAGINGDEEGGPEGRTNADMWQPLQVTSNTNVTVLEGLDADSDRETSLDALLSHGTKPQGSARMRSNLDPHCPGASLLWAKRAACLEGPLTEVHELLLLGMRHNTQSPREDGKHLKTGYPPPDEALALANVLPKGIVVCGPSGVGKSLVLDILCEDLRRWHGVHTVRVLGPEILADFSTGGSSGSSEGVLGSLLSKHLADALLQKPSTIVLDELDTLFDALDGDSRGSAPGAVGLATEGAQAATALLALLDRLQPGGGVAVLGATRRSPGGWGGVAFSSMGGAGGGEEGPIPAAFRKPGRLDRCVEIDPPTQAGRRDILRILLRELGDGLALESLGLSISSGSSFIAARAEFALGVPLVPGNGDEEKEKRRAHEGGDIGNGEHGARHRARVGGKEAGGDWGEGEVREEGEGRSAKALTVSKWAERLSILTPGFVGGDLARLIQGIRSRAVHRLQGSAPGLGEKRPNPPPGPMEHPQLLLLWSDVLVTVAGTAPRALLGAEVFSSGSGGAGDNNSKLTWGAVGGYKEAKGRLQRLVQWPWQHPEAFTRLGVSAPSGVLLCGPSGCGKSLIAQVLASECLANFIWVRSSELFSRYLGETEERFRSLFSRARAAAPCILFLDELDAITTKRDEPSGPAAGGGSGGSDDGGVHARVLSTLLNEMDGVASGGGRSGRGKSGGGGGGGGGVLVLGATNRREVLDAALLRPGRLQESVFLGLPSEEDRLGVLRVHGERLPLAEGVDLGRLSRDSLSGGMNCADLEATCREAAMMALREDLEGASEVRADHLTRALEKRRAERLRTQGRSFSVGTA